MQRLLVIFFIIFIVSSCAHQPAGVRHGMSSAAAGVGHLLLSPLQIVAGIAEGISALPYYLSTNLHQVNNALEQAQSRITIAETYESAYQLNFNDKNSSQSSAQRFKTMQQASTYFQRILQAKGVKNSHYYYLTSIDSANAAGYTLFAVIYRPYSKINIMDRYGKVHTYTANNRLFYEPHYQDASGRTLDTVIDWAGLARQSIHSQKAQALLLTLASNAVIQQKRSPEYWQIEARWLQGEYPAIMQQRQHDIEKKLYNNQI